MQVVVVGGGYAGLRVVQLLAAEKFAVTLVEPRAEHLLRGRLVAAATGRVPVREVSVPYARLLPAGVRHLQATALGFDPETTTVETDYETLRAERLVIAVGAEANLATPGAARYSLPLYTLEDLQQVLGHWTRIEEGLKRDRCDLRLLRWVIVGGGATGVELAAELVHLARRWRTRYGTLAEAIQIHLVERSDRLLPGWPADASEWATRWLRRHKVIVQTQMSARRVRAEGVLLEGPAGSEELASQTIFWAGGLKPVRLEEEPEGLRDRAQLLRVDSFLRLVDYPRTYAVGEAIPLTAETAPLGPLTAMYSAELAAANLIAEARNQPLAAFSAPTERLGLSLGAFDGLALVDGGQLLVGTAGWTVAQAGDLFYANAIQNPLLARVASELSFRIPARPIDPGSI